MAHEVGNMKKSLSTRSHFTHTRSCSRAQSSSHACETTGVLSGRILSEKETFFRSIVLLLSKYAPLQCLRSDACMSVIACIDCAFARIKKLFPASLSCKDPSLRIMDDSSRPARSDMLLKNFSFFISALMKNVFHIEE